MPFRGAVARLSALAQLGLAQLGLARLGSPRRLGHKLAGHAVGSAQARLGSGSAQIRERLRSAQLCSRLRSALLASAGVLCMCVRVCWCVAARLVLTRLSHLHLVLRLATVRVTPGGSAPRDRGYLFGKGDDKRAMGKGLASAAVR